MEDANTKKDKLPLSSLPALSSSSSSVEIIEALQARVAQLEQAHFLLKQNEAHTKIIVESASDVLLTISDDSQIIMVNPAVETIFGYSPTELLGQSLTLLMPDYLQRIHTEAVKRYLETGSRHLNWQAVELPGRHKNGQGLELEISFGEFTLHEQHFFTGIVRDITQRKNTERYLAVQYSIARVLSNAQALEGPQVQAALLAEIGESLHWEVGALWQPVMMVETATSPGLGTGLDQQQHRQKPREEAPHSQVTLTYTNGWHAAASSVGDDQQLQQPIMDFETHSQKLTFRPGVGLPGRVWASGKPLWLSPIDENTPNLPRRQLAHQAGLNSALGFPIVVGGETLGVIEFFSRGHHPPDQALLDLLLSVGKQIGQFILRKRVETQVMILERAFEATTSGIVISDPTRPDNPIIYANLGFERITGYSRQEVIGRNCRFLQRRGPGQGNDHDQADLLILKEALKTAQDSRVVLRNYRKDGTLFYNELVVSPVHNSQGQLINYIGIQNDVTERIKTQEQLRFSLERFNKIFKVTPVSIAISTFEEGIYRDVNDTFLELTNLTREEIIGRRATSLIWADPTQRVEFTRLLAAQGYVRLMEVNFYGKTGQAEPGLLSAEMIELGGEQCILSTFLNISERKRIEEALRQSQQQLLQSQKLESIGRLAGGIAHDFNNLLTAITGYSELILLSLPERDPMREDIDEINRAGQRAADLTRQLLAFSRQQMLQPQSVNLNLVVVGMFKLLGRIIGENIELITWLEPALNQVLVDPGQLEQVIVNLAVNARDAMPQGGKLQLKTSHALVNLEVSDSEQSLRVTRAISISGLATIDQLGMMKPGAYVVLEVSDSGAGMDEATKAQIFEPFFTTKEVGRGTGLGLSTVYGIIKQSEGYIWVSSEVGAGTTFRIYLPQYLEKVGAGAGGPDNKVEESRLSVSAKGDETILIVEDDEMVRNLAHRVLNKYGYTILEAENGIEALRVSAQYAGRIDLVITDILMPKMGGQNLIENLYQTRPIVRVLYMSGYNEWLATNQRELVTSSPVPSGFIHKPFTPYAFSRKVREMLDATK